MLNHRDNHHTNFRKCPHSNFHTDKQVLVFQLLTRLIILYQIVILPLQTTRYSSSAVGRNWTLFLAIFCAKSPLFCSELLNSPFRDSHNKHFAFVPLMLKTKDSLRSLTNIFTTADVEDFNDGPVGLPPKSIEEENWEKEEKRGFHLGSFHITLQKFILRFGLLDDFDIAIRYALCVFVTLCFMHYTPQDFLDSHLPGNTMFGTVSAILFMTPYIGSSVSSSLSWIMGSFVAVFFTFIVTSILGTDTHHFFYTSLADCSIDEVESIGHVGNPSAVGMGAMLLILNFSIPYFGMSNIWVKSTAIFTNLYLLLWFATMKNPQSAEKLDCWYFFKVSVSSFIGLAFANFFIFLPLPRWDVTPKGIIGPKMAISRSKEHLRMASIKLSAAFKQVIESYQIDNSHIIREQSLMRTRAILVSAQRHLDECNVYLNAGAQWEPSLFPSSMRYQTIIEYESLLRLLTKQLFSVLLTFKVRAETIPFRHTWHWKAIENLFPLLDKIENLVYHTLKSHRGLRMSLNQNNIEQLNVHMAVLRAELSQIFDFIKIDTDLNEMDREKAFHCNCLWKIHNICSTIISINDTLSHPKGVYYPRRLLVWITEYFVHWWNSFYDILLLVTCRQSLRKFIFHRQRYFGASVQIAIAALLGSLFVLIDDLREKIPTAYAIVTTAVTVMDRDNPGSQFVKFEARLSGTALSIGAAFIISTFWPDGSSIGSIFLISALALIARYVQCSPKYSYMPYAFMVTLFSILFQITPNHYYSDVITATNSRATATTISIALAAICNILWPIRCRQLIRHRIVRNITNHFIPLINGTFSIFEQFPHETGPRLQSLLSKIDKNLKDQKSFMANAVLEPDLWRHPFPFSAYEKVFLKQCEVYTVLVGCQKMNNRFLALMEEHPLMLRNIFEPEPWDLFRDVLIQRLRNVSLAIEYSRRIRRDDRPLQEYYCDWIVSINKDLTMESLPLEAHTALWGFLWNCRILVGKIVELRMAVDGLYEVKACNRERGIPVGLCPSVIKF